MPALIPLDNVLGAFFIGVIFSSMCGETTSLPCFVSVRLLVLPLPGAFKVSRLGRIAFVRPRQPHCQQMTHLEQNIGFAAVGLGRSRILCRRGNQFWRLLGRS